jgi:hypothetical protein
MKYQVPQFIEVEDKLFGPLTFRQFVYLLGAGGFSFIMFRIFPTFVALLVSAPVIALGLALAFYKINNKPFIFVLEAAFRYLIGSKLYVWRKEQKIVEREEKTTEEKGKIYIPKLSNSKLSDIAWGLDIQERVEDVNSKFKI